MSENYFNSLKKYLKECTNFLDHPLLENMDNLYSHIFLLSKKGEFEAAREELNLADQRYDFLVKSTQVKDHVNILRLPIIAYLLFKIGEYNKASTLLQESVDASIALEKTQASFFLEMFRVQQYHNDARIEFKREAYDLWGSKMKKQVDHIIACETPLQGDEILVYVTMVDQLIYETIKFSEFIKEDKHIQNLVKDLEFLHPLFHTNDTLKGIQNWCSVKSKVDDFEINFINAYEQIEDVLCDRALKDLYKTSLLKSVARYVSDEVFLAYLDIIKGKKLIS